MQSWTCLHCGKKFKEGSWVCEDGLSNHVVEVKQYRSLDAPSDPGTPAKGGVDSLRDGRARVCNIPPPRKVMEAGEVRMVGEGFVEFIRGRFSTADPEVQYWL